MSAPVNPGESALRTFARHRNLRVRPCVDVYLDPAEPATSVAVTEEGGWKCRIAASSDHVTLTVKGEMPVFFSVGRPHPALLTDTPIRDNACRAGATVYAFDAYEGRVADWFSVPENCEAVRSLGICPGESLHVAGNESLWVVLADREIEAALHIFVRFMNVISEVRSRGVRPQRLLPPCFEDLEEVAREWCIDDDVERAERLSSIDPSARVELAKKLERRLGDIDRYLANAEQPLSVLSQHLQLLGQLGAELRISRVRRSLARE